MCPIPGLDHQHQDWAEGGLMMINRRRMTSVAAAGALTLGSVIAIGAPTVAEAASVCGDTTAPKLQDLKLSKKSVDVRHGSATINVTAKWKDDLSGVTSVSMSAGSPEVHGVSRGAGATLKRTAGTPTDGTFTGKLTIPQYTINGTWTIALSASDKVGNGTYLSSAQLITDGLQGKLKVQSNPDVIPPKVTSFSFSPKTVDSRNGNKSFTVTANVTDKGGSKVSSVYASFGRSVANKGNYGTAASLRRVGSSNKYVGKAVVNKYDDRDVKATWLASLSATDRVGQLPVVHARSNCSQTLAEQVEDPEQVRLEGSSTQGLELQSQDRQRGLLGGRHQPHGSCHR